MRSKLDDENVVDRHVGIIRSIVSAGMAAKNVTQLDVHKRPGSCVITPSCPAVQEARLCRILKICGKEYHPIPSDGSVELTHISIYGCPTKLHELQQKVQVQEKGPMVLHHDLSQSKTETDVNRVKLGWNSLLREILSPIKVRHPASTNSGILSRHWCYHVTVDFILVQVINTSSVTAKSWNRWSMVEWHWRPFSDTAQLTPVQARNAVTTARARIPVEKAIKHSPRCSILNFEPHNYWTCDSNMFHV